MAPVSEDSQKRIKALQKKVVQICKLKEKSGGLTPEETAKVESEAGILKEIRALEKGEVYNPTVAAPAPAAAPAAAVPAAANGVNGKSPAAVAQQRAVAVEPQGEEPEEVEAAPPPDLEPGEAEKRIKNLKKKLQQIQKLKERGGQFSPEEAEKISHESGFLGEVMDLEIGTLPAEAKKIAFGIKKKLDQIKKLKEKNKGSLTAPEKEKISKAKELQQELDKLLASRPVFKEDKPKAAPAPAKTKEKAAPAPAPKPAPVPVVVPEPVYVPEDVYEAEIVDPYMAGEPPMDDDDGFVTMKKKAPKKKAASGAEADEAGQSWEERAPEQDTEEQQTWKASGWVDWQEPSKALGATAKAEPAPKPKAEATPPGEQTPEKRIKALKKKLAQIDKLKQKAPPLLEEEESKLAAEGLILQEIGALERGETWEPPEEEPEEKPQAEAVAAPEPEAPAPVAKQAPAPAPAPEPAPAPAPAPEPDCGPEEAGKRVKALRKKMKQIDGLKQRGGSYTKEESDKIASEKSLLKEVAALEKLM